MAKKYQPPLHIQLRSGDTLRVRQLGLSGYIAAPIGAALLGGTASGNLVGKFAVGVRYEDGTSGLIAQEEIADIRDSSGKKVAWGNASFPGHPDFDPRSGWKGHDAYIMETTAKMFAQKEKYSPGKLPRFSDTTIWKEEEEVPGPKDAKKTKAAKKDKSSKKSKVAKKVKSSKKSKAAKKVKSSKKSQSSKKAKATKKAKSTKKSKTTKKAKSTKKSKTTKKAKAAKKAKVKKKKKS
jgi:hypothetical protein